MKLIRDFRHVVGHDLGLFRGRPRLLASCLAVTLVPAFYAWIYLGAAWDPYGHLDQLPVALVDADVGGEVRGRRIELGASIARRLEERHGFALRRVESESEALAMVEQGELAFAVILPSTLTVDALAASTATPARIRVAFSEGASYVSSAVARRFADELVRSTNATLGTERWAMVLGAVDASQMSLEKLRQGVHRLREGAERLDRGLDRAAAGGHRLAAGSARAEEGAIRLRDGARPLSDGTVRLVDGVRLLGDGLRRVEESLPPDDRLAALSTGARRAAEGQAELTRGLGMVGEGAAKAREGAGRLRASTGGIPIIGGKIAEGAGQLEAGLGRLEEGIVKARAGSEELAAGEARVSEGVAKLADGVTRLGGGVRTMVARLPAPEALDQLGEGSLQVADGAAALADGTGALSGGARELAAGLTRLSSGAGQLAHGLTSLEMALPPAVEGPNGDAMGLAMSIEPELVALTRVGAYGNSIVPYFLGLSLWVGVVVCGFIFQLRWFPDPVRSAHRLALVLGRLAVPLLIVLGQATLLTLALRFLVGATIPSLGALWLIAVCTSAVFLSVFLMLVGLLGDPGKVVALLLLVFQLGASGGIFPLALSGPLFGIAHPYLPFSWVLRAARAALFGAYGGAWLPALGTLSLFGCVAVGVTAALARWKFVPEERFGPLMDA